MSSVPELSLQLAKQDTQAQVLIRLLQLSSGGHDVSGAAEHVVRYCLRTSAPTPQVLSLALDVLNASPAHRHWKDAISVIISCVRVASTSREAAIVALTKVPGLPHAAVQHVGLYATGVLTDTLLTAQAGTVRLAAVSACAALALRARPLTAPSVDTVRLEQPAAEHEGILRASIARCLHTLVDATFEPGDAVAVAAFSTLCAYAARSDAQRRKSVLSATRDATADAVWQLLITRQKELSKRFEPLANSESSPHRRLVVKALAQLAARCLAARPLGSTPGEHAEWAAACVEKTLSPLCAATSEPRVAATACSALLHVCANTGPAIDQERVAKWGVRATARIAKLLQEKDHIPTLVVTGLVQDATRGLAALSKNENATRKFIADTSVNLLGYGVQCPRRSQRLEALAFIAATVIEYDLGGRGGGVGSCLSSLIKSATWKRILVATEEPEDSPIRAELVCCFGHALLDAARKIADVDAVKLREGLTDVWATMLAGLVRATLPCLSWSMAPAVAYAKQVFLKMFEALGQYSGFILRTRGVGMQEYEQIQEAMVKACTEQEDVDTRSALLTCITKYWLTSGLKAESNAGHVLTAIWKHAQHHFRGEEVMLRELHVGVTWSDAQTGGATPAQRAVEGGYVSVTTAISKRSRAIADTVSTSVTTALEETLFGSIALRTAAAEGSTLITDYSYVVLSSALALAHQNPKIADQVISLLHRYRNVLDAAHSEDLIAYEAINNALAACAMYQEEYFPKAVPVRNLFSSGQNSAVSNTHAWLARVTESCVYATSRVDDPAREAGTVSTEEAILRAGAAVRAQMRGFNAGTLHSQGDTQVAIEGDQQTLNGAADPLGVVASHAMDTVKGLALLSITVTNRSTLTVPNASLTCAASGALAPLPDAPGEMQLGTLEPGASIAQQVTYAVRYNQGYAGRIYLTLHVRGDSTKDAQGLGGVISASQSCAPYYVPSSDVLLLRAPTPGAGVDVFRRRWDLMRAQAAFHVVLGRAQSVDSLVDTLERRSGCLRQVGRMRVYSHVSCLAADSSRGDYVALAILAPEAVGTSGRGACVAHVRVRANTHAYAAAFSGECRDWLKTTFKVVNSTEDAANSRLALRPEEAYFVTDGDGLSPYQRWRRAHAERMAH